MPDLLITGGTIAVPDLPPLQADVLVNYDRPLLREGGVIVDIGDMGETEAQDTMDASGLYLVPMADALDEHGGLDIGSPALFLLAEDAAGQQVSFRFEGGPPKPED